MLPPGFHGACRCSSSTDSAMLASSGDKMPPCGVPVSVSSTSPSSVLAECAEQPEGHLVVGHEHGGDALPGRSPLGKLLAGGVAGAGAPVAGQDLGHWSAG